MARTILCAIDEHTHPEIARTAGELAAGLGSRVVLAHVAGDLARFHAAGERSRSAAIKRGGAHLERVRDALPEELQAPDRIELGSPVETLLDIAGDEDAELIVVGSRGRGALRSALLGSVSRRLTAQAPCPVVIVTPGAVEYRASRPDGSDGRVPSLVCGIDGSEPSLKAARLAADLADRLGDRLLLLHAHDARRRNWVSGLADADWPASDGTKPTRLIEPGPPAYALESVAGREGARLIVVGARAMGPLRSALVGSVSAQLIGTAGCPVVIVPEHAQLGRGSGHYETQSAA